MTKWPWITFLLGPAAALTPPGQEIIRQAFLSGEQLSRSIGGFVFTTAMLFWTLLMLIEWLVRILVARRRRDPGAGTSQTE